jgi:hypothetical protein
LRAAAISRTKLTANRTSIATAWHMLGAVTGLLKVIVRMVEIAVGAEDVPVAAGGIVDAAGAADGRVAADGIAGAAALAGDGTRSSLPWICADSHG